MTITPVERRRLSDAVVEQLTELITSGTYNVGDRLPSERDLAKSLGVSRTLVRESFRILESLGFVAVKPGVGAIVTQHNPIAVDIANYLWSHSAEVLEVVDVREVLIVRATELAATRISDEELQQLDQILDAQKAAVASSDATELVRLDDEFHALIFSSARNKVLSAVEEYTRGVLNNVRWNVLTLTRRRVEALAEHERILLALKQHHAKDAYSAGKIHAQRSFKEIRKFVQERGETGQRWPRRGR